MLLAQLRESANAIVGDVPGAQIAKMIDQHQNAEIQHGAQSDPGVSAPRESVKSADARGLPRWVEVPLAFVGLIVLAPLLALAGLAILLSSGRPIIFRQIRVGKNGRNFELYKLRTMKPSSGGPQITSGTDKRITRLGRFLRHTKIDELPPLWNVLRGEMSLVGPRPEVPRFVVLKDPLWQKVLSVRPGITDPVSVQLRSEADLLAQIEGDTEQYYVNELQPAKLRGYVAYLEKRTWKSDLGVLGQTFLAVIAPREFKTEPGSVKKHSPGTDSIRRKGPSPEV
jgi:lipopolysaccharide/colanic/teichoic acid biosynthesis glycosyltransferase